MQGDKEDKFPRYLSFNGWAESYYSCRFFDEKGPSWFEVLVVPSLNPGKELTLSPTFPMGYLSRIV